MKMRRINKISYKENKNIRISLSKKSKKWLFMKVKTKKVLTLMNLNSLLTTTRSSRYCQNKFGILILNVKKIMRKHGKM